MSTDWRVLSKEQCGWSAATLGICIAFILIDVLFLRNETADVSEERTAEQSVTTAPAERAESLIGSNNLPLVSLVSVSLPRPPAQAKSPLAAELATEARIPRPSKVPQVNEAIPADMVVKEVASAEQTYAAQHASANDDSAWDTQALMSELSSAQMRIAMPSIEREKRHVLNFLYQCVGIGLGAIEQQGANYSLMPLIDFPNHPSKVLRRISGQMSEQEQTLQQVYARHQALVRIYPSAMDVRLAQHLSMHLHGQKLVSFSGEYSLEKNRLLLTNIYINQDFVPQTWLLHDGAEHRCRL